MTEKFVEWTPYNYCFNNPILFIDPDGQEGVVVSGQPGDHKNRKHFLENVLVGPKLLINNIRKKVMERRLLGLYIMAVVKEGMTKKQ